MLVVSIEAGMALAFRLSSHNHINCKLMVGDSRSGSSSLPMFSESDPRAGVVSTDLIPVVEGQIAIHSKRTPLLIVHRRLHILPTQSVSRKLGHSVRQLN